MAKTYTVAEALSIAGGQVGRKVEDYTAAYIANMAMGLIWNKYDWRETVSDLPPFYLVPGEQEYGAPAVIVPTDFKGFRKAYLVDVNTPANRMTLKTMRDIQLTGVEDMPSIIGFEPSVSKFRVFPRFPQGFGATDWLIDGTYKKRPTKITPSTLQTTLIPWDDQYFNVFVAATKWAALENAGDQRAGQITEQMGLYRVTGQLAVAHEAIDRMAQDEGLDLGDPSIAPSEPLVGTDCGFSSLGIY